jgi:hypothetical protein
MEGQRLASSLSLFSKVNEAMLPKRDVSSASLNILKVVMTFFWGKHNQRTKLGYFE